MQTPSFSGFPTISYLYPRFLQTETARDAWLDRCHAMGFTHVMLACDSFTAEEQKLSQAGEMADARGRNAALDDAQSEFLGKLVTACQSRQLQVIVAAEITALPADVLSHGSKRIEQNEDNPPDPRRPIAGQSASRVDLRSPEMTEYVLSYWSKKLDEWIGGGIAGFCWKGLGDVAPLAWRSLVDHARQLNANSCMLAWTPGCSADQVLALADAGFDATFSSAAWWNYKAEWLTEEYGRLAEVAQPMAFPDSPFSPQVHCFDEIGDPEANRRAHERALWLAASIGCGLLVPMGFELGISEFLRNPTASPPDLDALMREASFDLSREVAEACATVRQLGEELSGQEPAALELLGSGEGHAIALLRRPRNDTATDRQALLIVANQNLHAEGKITLSRLGERMHGFVALERWLPELPNEGGSMALGSSEPELLKPGALKLFRVKRPKPVLLPATRGKRGIDAALRVPRVAIEAVSPAVDGGRFPAKRIVGELVEVEADVFMDGHDKLGVALLWRSADEAEWQEARMQPLGNDRWRAVMPLNRLGRHYFVVEAWRDAFATYRDELEKKVKAGLDVRLELEEGRLLVAAAAAHAKESDLSDAAEYLAGLAKLLSGVLDKRGRKMDIDPAERIAGLLSDRTLQAMRRADARPFAVRSENLLAIDAERTAARFSSWYELFPRSQSGDPLRHGTFADVEKRLPAIRDMGFDTLYFPPIHPIGKRNRKGRNNSLTATESDPGSPYAIGAAEGGHDAIHPELGTLDDFRRLRDAAARHGLELALDFAIQCSPDHPWLAQHPEWFAWRPDGSLRYAENPPKKYEDIVNVDFYAEGAMPSLWIALRDAVLFWVKEGVRVFRVDNPHTKPLPFWQWMIGDIRSRYPDTIFLSEAFTRPKVMYRLAKVGFSQSYTYFTWRNTKAEFTEYLTELTTTSVRDYFRPHFFVNTPDINPVFLQHSGRAGFLIRAALATTLSGLWGMYSGFELCEATPVPGKEEYLDSEKYEIRAWDWQRPGNIIAEITALNRIRSANPALQTHLGIRFCASSNDHILCFVKSTPHPTKADQFGDNVVFVAVNLDPFSAHDSSMEIPLWRFGLPDDGALEVEDLINGRRFGTRGKMQHIRLDPFTQPYAIWRLHPEGGAA